MKTSTIDWIRCHRDEVDRCRGRWVAVHPEEGIVLRHERVEGLRERLDEARDGVEFVWLAPLDAHEDRTVQRKTIESALWAAYQAGVQPLDEWGRLTPAFLKLLTDQGVEVL